MNRGKKIAIGGSITLITHAVARYTPSNRKPESHQGNPTEAPKLRSTGWTVSMSTEASIAEGTFAPAMVSQKTTMRITSMSGNPSHLLVSRRSSVRSKVNLAFFGPVRAASAAMTWAAAYTLSVSAS